MTMPARNLRIWHELLLHLWDSSYLERQRLVGRWLDDLVPFPGEAYRQFVKELVQANKLVRGDLVIDGNAADPSQITCPVLVLAHTGDVLAPPASAQALLEVVSSADREALTVSGGTLGHVDIVVGPEGPALMWPKLTAWLETRSGAGR
jgi:polyhydroxyalkanoate synthase subunit PhaC